MSSSFERSEILKAPPEKILSLINNFELYKEFLPGCLKSSRLPNSKEGYVIGRLVFSIFNKTYVFENYERRQKEEPLEIKLTMENSEDNGLGISLPGGKVEVYLYSQLGGLEYIGADNIGQVPKGQSAELTSGRAFDVIGNRKVLNYDRQRKSEEAVIEIKVTNARNEKEFRSSKR